ncbi:ATP-binding cassette domain-containing protein, partial [Candidatus Parvarchaeota archaeon]|nr:ATP-binding cassette domain-containing protein [Candidatus Parvarchaeota archaeon]
MPRIAIIDRNKCTREKCGYLCMKLCPGVRMGDDTVTIDAEGWPVISEVLCTGCGICPKRCPVDAIKIINTPAEVGTPIFQYGVNTFRLYGLPLPQKGVVGLIGKNGIGKTTALQLLTAALKPNFGIVGSEAKGPEGLSWGTENAAKKSRGRIPLADEKSEDAKSGKKILGIQERQYFEALSGKKIKVALKPQNVDRIPAAFGGKVETLLKKLDEREALDEAVGLFELEHALGKTTKELSGGELQRVAVAACYIKDADIYYFDEPASYLDIEQRLIVAKAIRGLAEKHGKKVIVIEHDMALFDYLSDYVYVFYGEENTYGVCSGVKATRNGVNEYLDGYLKDENVRFRENEIRFDAGAGGERKSREKLAYPSMKKR